MTQPATIRLDVHAHQIPLRPGDGQGIAGVQWTDDGLLRLDGKDLPKRELYRGDALVEWMDTQRVEQAWISVPPTLYRPQIDEAAARTWADTVNRGLQAVAARHPDRLAPLLHLPVQHPAVATGVVQAGVAQGQRRFAMAAGDAARGLMLSDPDYAPLWHALDVAGAFLFLHPSSGCDPRLDRFSLQNLLGNPGETALAAAHLAMAGVVERHPRIVFCLAHGGGTAGAVVGRLERGQHTQRAGIPTEGCGVRAVFRHFCADCITHDAAALQLVAATHGSAHVLFGSDWPFEMGLTDPHEQLKDVPDEQRRRIFANHPEARP